MQKKYFGTDGIRAASNSYKLNGLTMMRLGMSLGNFAFLLINIRGFIQWNKETNEQ